MRSMEEVIRRKLLKLSVLILALVALLSNAGMLWAFGGYLRESRKEEDLELVRTVEAVMADGRLENTERSGLMQAANQLGVHVQLQLEDAVVLDSLQGRGHGMMGNRTARLEQAVLVYKEYSLKVPGLEGLVLKVGRTQGWFLSVTEQSFILGMNLLYLGVFLLALGVVAVTGRKVSRQLSRPVTAIQQATEKIRRGDYSGVELAEDSTLELHNLSGAIQELARQLAKQEEIRKRMTTDIAHEMRSPLAVVRSQIEAMMDGVLEVDHERFARLDGEIMRLTKLLEDLNELSIVENELYTLHRTRFDLSGLVEESVERFGPMYESKGLELRKEIRPGLFFHGDPDRMAQVLNNLLSNSCKYTDAGFARVRLEGTEQAWTLTVEDTGIGIPEKDLPYIFDRFYRVDPSRSRLTGGAGIGLAIVRKIADAHGLEVEAGPGGTGGTRFALRHKSNQ
ncbi:sensor histidine kinase [Anaerotalea alkaliphila]|uniref:histidine kinase n=1 Tax=Anaerotalea alkaliphila TaxID=2662126 RepID=A0A7X5KLS5_9FIRM|nr:ATP-binding protein [Anaerotalea alkaliphila]NDL67141.1 hypothetical protein [Anaerotalea alkaliphila]